MPDELDLVEETAKIQRLIDELFEAGRDDCAAEIQALQSIYGDLAIRLHSSPSTSLKDRSNASRTVQESGEKSVRYDVHTSLEAPFDNVTFTLCVTLPPSYPFSRTAPQMQLLSRYIGPYSVDADIFGSVMRTFISANPARGGVPLWAASEIDEDGEATGGGEVVVFDGVETVRALLTTWYGERESETKVAQLARGDHEAGHAQEGVKAAIVPPPVPKPRVEAAIPEGIELIEGPPIVDRGSTFVARVCRIADPSQIPPILSFILQDKHNARAAHPTINAWRCTVSGVLHSDNDDDGETAAGSRLAHLLQILELDHVLVVVTRWFGGVHLGPDRFKHINQCARDALEIAGFLDDRNAEKTTVSAAARKGPRKGKR